MVTICSGQSASKQVGNQCGKCTCSNKRVSCEQNTSTCFTEERTNKNTLEEKDDECDACRDEVIYPVCAVNEGRTFPTSCHAIKCQKIQRSNIRDGPCKNRVSS